MNVFFVIIPFIFSSVNSLLINKYIENKLIKYGIFSIIFL